MCGYPVRTGCGRVCGGQDLQTHFYFFTVRPYRTEPPGSESTVLLRFKTATVQSGKGMQVHRGTTTFDRHAVGTSGEWVGMSGTPWVRYMDVPNMLFPACAMNTPLGVVEWER